MSSDASHEPITLVVEDRAHGWRLDHFLVRLYPNYSRSLFQKAISAGSILVNGLAAKPGRRLRVNDVLSVQLPDLPDSSIPAENIPLSIIAEDDSLVVINKPAGMIVHPGRGNPHGTLAAALQFHFDSLSDVAGQFRPGIVHRLDRDTSGLLLVAKDNQVHHRLSGQFERREVKKEYHAIVWGEVELDSDFIETYVRVHSKNREKMVVCAPGGEAREAITFYEVIERFRGFTYVRLHPKTGRTHQLRIHMQHLKHPIVADRMYGGHAKLEKLLLTGEKTADSGYTEEGEHQDSTHGGREILISRQALHAQRLHFTHPRDGRAMEFEAPLPADIQTTLDALRIHRAIQR